MTSNQCFENGYNPNKKGRCCCNCVHRVVIKKHPWNEGDMKGSITEIGGYGCGAMAPGEVIFFGQKFKHSLCEEHTFREEYEV